MEKPVGSLSLHRTPGPHAAQLLAAVRLVLLAPSHPGNIGAAARAMATMGLADLVVVAPRYANYREHDEARAFAGHGLDRLQASRQADSLEAAVADCQLVIGVSAEAREFGPEPRSPGASIRAAFDLVDAGRVERVALVFGTERTGLSIREAGLCQWLTSIPAEPARSSLNLAQAVQIMAWAVREAALARQALPGQAVPGDEAAVGQDAAARLADRAAVEGFFAHLERAMIACEFLDPAVPKRLMPRMRRLFNRSGLEIEEVDLLRGLCTQIERVAARRSPSAASPARDGDRAGDKAAGTRGPA